MGCCKGENASGRINGDRLFKWNLGIGCLQVACAAVFTALGDREATIPLVTMLWRRPSFLPEWHVIRDIYMVYHVTAFLGISGLVNIGRTIKGLRRGYERHVENRFSYTRWFDYVLTSPIMTSGVAMLSGMIEFYTQFLLIVNQVLVIICGARFEYIHSEMGAARVSQDDEVVVVAMAEPRARSILEAPRSIDTRSTSGIIAKPPAPRKETELRVERGPRTDAGTYDFWLGCVPFLANWLLIGCAYGRAAAINSPPGWVTALVASMFLWFSIFPIIAYAGYRRFGWLHSFENTELAYTIVGGFAKITMAAIQFGGSNNI